MAKNGPQKVSDVTVKVAIISLIGVLGAAIITNIDKIITQAKSLAGYSGGIGENEASVIEEIYYERRSESDVCYFFISRLEDDRVEEYRKRLWVHIGNQTQILPINTEFIEDAPDPYQAKFKIPCQGEYTIGFSWELFPTPIGSGEPSLAGENTFSFVSQGEVIQHWLPWFPTVEYSIGFGPG